MATRNVLTLLEVTVALINVPKVTTAATMDIAKVLIRKGLSCVLLAQFFCPPHDNIQYVLYM